MPQKKPATSISINLLPKDPFYDSVIGKGTTWALSIGRYLVIFTELVVIISFASRFTLDRQVTDLNKSILTKQAVIESYGDLEENVREVQQKLTYYTQATSFAPTTAVFDILTAITPTDVTFKNLSISGDAISFSAHASTTDALSQFLTNVQTSPYFQNVTVEQISNKDPLIPGFEFTLKANFISQQE